MELPIDHFRLLGVSPTTDAQSVLRTLEHRLNRAPDDGFTSETLQAREALLRDSADLLTDTARRQVYEAELTAHAGTGHPVHGLKIPSSRELGGLLLLLEAGQPLECFDLACRRLQPPQAPTLGSGRETDLSRLAALACLAASREQKDHRLYEAAAHTLRSGLQLLQRVGQHPHLRQAISEELQRLRPFRVLDLLSRNLAAIEERSEGLALLEELVRDRGGLEGDADPTLSPEDFQAFFKQIRDHLTVQEQIDLFSRWASDSPAADFVASTALTASGFAQRKPERIAEAQQRLESSGLEGLQPLLACLHLLLGQVEAAQRAFQVGADPALLRWAENQSSDPLGQLCAWCSEWLARDVLPHYRDLEAEADLEAYFADRDVQAYIERLAPPVLSPPFDSPGLDPFSNPFTAAQGSAESGPFRPPLEPEAPGGDDFDDELDWQESWMPHWPPQWRLPSLNWPSWRPPGGRRGLITAAAVAAGVLGLGLVALLRPRPPATPIVVQPVAGEAPPGQSAEKPAGQQAGQPASSTPTAPQSTAPQSTASQPTPSQPAAAPLRSAEPSEAEIKALLERWLAAKAAVLAGKEAGQPLDSLARPAQIERLEQERRDDAARNETQAITTAVEGLTITEQGPNRIAAEATIRYSDQRRGPDGNPLGQASQLELRNRYVFGRDGDVWRLAGFGPTR
ncbi:MULTISPECIES: ARC6/PARC6 family protein [Aphanothece]|uniref:ARC6/PARC6 family protein n=1 Tax=Aphanothece TaxID=1121 RepID=UPI003984D87F